MRGGGGPHSEPLRPQEDLGRPHPSRLSRVGGDGGVRIEAVRNPRGARGAGPRFSGRSTAPSSRYSGDLRSDMRRAVLDRREVVRRKLDVCRGEVLLQPVQLCRPRIGTIHGFWASSHARAICAGVAFFRSAMSLSSSTKAMFPSGPRQAARSRRSSPCSRGPARRPPRLCRTSGRTRGTRPPQPTDSCAATRAPSQFGKAARGPLSRVRVVSSRSRRGENNG
jgi:hypothetical protein